jgi:hypothetical protein
MANKNAVLDFLKHNRTLRIGRDLYNKFSNKNLATQSYFSNIGNTPENVKIVCYELCKLVGIPERQMNALIKQPVTAKVAEEVVAKKEPSVEKLLLNFDENSNSNALASVLKSVGLEFNIPVFSKGPKGTNERKALLKSVKIETKAKTNKALDAEINKFSKGLVDVILAKKQALIETKLQALPEDQKQSIKIRDQFPFLKEKECPTVLKLLVADLITAHEVFVTNQPLLHKNASASDLKALCSKVVASYVEKKEAFAELEFYGKNKALLGVHPLFKQLEEEAAIVKMNVPELGKEIANLTSNINRNKKKETASKTPEDVKFYNDLHTNQQRLKDFVIAEQAKR